MEVLQKIFEARQKIKETKLKSAGWNDYSKYYYYTPEQINQLITPICNELKILNTFQLKRDEHGLNGIMNVLDLESKKSKDFIMATDIPSIKATNIAQQLGGTMTYTERYLLMSIYDIKDNNLDFDIKGQIKDTRIKLKENTKEWSDVCKAIDNGYTINDIEKKYILSDEIKNKLK